MKNTDFIAHIWQQSIIHQRSMPWRDNTDPYWIVVSEVMLQQTQVSRVLPKFEQFVATFPNLEALAQATLRDVLHAWSGLGYNRRAKFLHQAAQQIVAQYDTVVPKSRPALEQLPGIGPNTAGAILAYAYNQPVIFIETNIRSVYLHHFFPGQTSIADADLLKLVKATLDIKKPREWYWALMDYGSWLKQQLPNPSRASRHHAIQSQFEGSVRQLRGEVIRLLLSGVTDKIELVQCVNDARLSQVLLQLEHEQIIVSTDNNIRIA